ncbi:MAG: ornithine carbamoyltransferase, partial [Campylobacteraceae bacterium]|jgi:ornithine carbamoyltransferase|nr:ornithine carbamoyltransferase [Campylobacteraceae bacterium]
MIFEKSSTRTRVSFEVGIHQLGGKGLFLSTDDIQLGRGEPLKDTARVLSRMVDMVMIRTFGQERLEEFAKYSTIPLISGLSDTYHPMQLLADYMTICEYGKNKDLIVAYVGDGNNIANSWLMLASKIGFEFRISTPKGYEADKNVLKDAYEFAKKSDSKIVICENPKDAVKDAGVVTTDTWVSMGQESEKERRIRDFEGFMVDSKMLALAQKDAMFLHCLPAYRGYEVSDEVFEEHANEIFDEAENRLHVQKAVMVWLDGQR